MGEQYTPYGYILSKLYMISIQFKSINHLFKLSIQLKSAISGQSPVIPSHDPIQIPDKILVSLY